MRLFLLKEVKKRSAFHSFFSNIFYSLSNKPIKHNSNMATKNDVAHNWAHQLKTRQTSGNLSFEGCLIYSYRTAIGEVITLKDGTKIYILNTGNYSHSTSKHQNYAFGAIPTDAIKFSVSCDDFEQSWGGLTWYRGNLSDKYCKRTCKSFVQKHLVKTFEMLEEFSTSKAMKIEEEFSLKWFDEAVRFCELTKMTTIKQVLKEKSETIKKWWYIKNPAAFKKTMLAILSGERSLHVLVDIANGDGIWQEYLARTKGVRASKEARKINLLLGFDTNSNWNVYYQPYHYNYSNGGKNTCATFPTNETYISRAMQGQVPGGFKASQIAKLRENGQLIVTLLECKRKNFQLNCASIDNHLRVERKKKAKERLELHLGFTGFERHWYSCSGNNRRASFNYDGTVVTFNFWNRERSLGWEEYNDYAKMSFDEQKEFIHTKRLEMLAQLKHENEEHERFEREQSERQRIAREEREKVAKLYAEKKSYIEEMKAKGDTGVKQLWHEGLLGNNLYGKPNSFFNGGNALLRVSITGEQVESSKGIRVSITECKRLWAIINRWHTEHKEFDMDDYETIHATTSDWGIKRYQNDIMIAGCHAIAYSEMAAVAKQLGFC